MHAHEVHAHKMHAHKMYAHEMYAHRCMNREIFFVSHPSPYAGPRRRWPECHNGIPRLQAIDWASRSPLIIGTKACRHQSRLSTLNCRIPTNSNILKRNQEFDDDQVPISGELKRREVDRENSWTQLGNEVEQNLVSEGHKSSARSPYPNDDYTVPMTSELLAHGDYTVGWVCALPKEQTAAIAMLDRRHPDLTKSPNDHNAYTLGSIGKHNVGLACLPKGRVGNNSSATVATRMISTFPSIKFGLMVGIGGGIPPKVRLGDVVVSTPMDGFPGVVQWDFGKAEQGGSFKRTGSLNSPPSALLTALTKLETEHEMNGPKIPQYLDDLKRSGQGWRRNI